MHHPIIPVVYGLHDDQAKSWPTTWSSSTTTTRSKTNIFGGNLTFKFMIAKMIGIKPCVTCVPLIKTIFCHKIFIAISLIGGIHNLSAFSSLKSSDVCCRCTYPITLYICKEKCLSSLMLHSSDRVPIFRPLNMYWTMNIRRESGEWRFFSLSFQSFIFQRIWLPKSYLKDL